MDPSSGRLVRIYGALQNITERKRAQAALEESESRYRELVEASPDAIVLHSQGVVVYINPAGVRLLGAESEDQIEARPVLDFVPAETHPYVTQRTSELRTTGHLEVSEEQLIRLDGRRVDVEVNGSLISFQGRPAVQLVIRDISERKAAQMALAENQRLLQQLTDAISEVFFVQDGPSGRALFVSPAYEEIWGRSLSSLSDDPRSWLKAIHAEDRERVKEVTTPAGDSSPYEVEYRVVRPDGTQRWVVERGLPCGTSEATWFGSPASHGTSPSGSSSRNSCCNRRRWRRSAASPEAWPTTSTIF
jgi:PAS domain S-box-containing protein